MWERLDLQVRWMFDEVQSLAPPSTSFAAVEYDALRQDLKSIRHGYHERQQARGLCRSCPQPRSPESKSYCMKHLEVTRASARRSAKAKRESR